MAYEFYKSFKFRQLTLDKIDQANAIIEEYQEAGFSLTVRQLYYQFVARGLIDNNQKEYIALSSVINNARLAGLIDWYAIVDRTRNLEKLATWETPEDIIDSAVSSFRQDIWRSQECRVEVWVEKEALIGVIESICDEYRVPYIACRGYMSQSEQWAAARRARDSLTTYGARTHVIHLGDHDPSGIDMSRDIEDRYHMFSPNMVSVHRIALNYDQVEQYRPPPNPVKLTDTRRDTYTEIYGASCWELDALEPKVISDLIGDKIQSFIDFDKWGMAMAQESEHINHLHKIIDNYDNIVDFLDREDY